MSGSTTISQPTKQQPTWALRVAFFTSLLVAAAVCGAVSYVVVDNLEQSVGFQTFDSLAKSALDNAKAITLRKLHGLEAMASILSHAYPNASEWPYVGLDGYVQTAGKIALLSNSGTVAVNFLVRPDQVETFGQHAKAYYQAQGFPETAGYSDFGFGIWKPDLAENQTYPDGRIPDTTGNPNNNGTNFVLLPIFLHNNVTASSLLLNAYSRNAEGEAVGSMLDCAASVANDGIDPPRCTAVTDFLVLVVRPGPAAILYEPVYTKNNPTTIVAIAAASIHWEEVLTAVVPDYVDGLDCVVSSDTDSFTYVIRNGIPILVGEGDLHVRNYDHMGRSQVLNTFVSGALASKQFTLTVYPTDTMLDEFRTNSPVAIALAFVGVILLCAVVFVCYDFFMRGEARHQKEVLDVKRRFVRFVSHEIRSPLNTVCMGLELLQSELESLRDRAKKEKVNYTAKNPQMHRGLNGDVDSGGEDNGSPTKVGEPKLSLIDSFSYLMDLTGDILGNSESAVTILNDLLNYDKIETGTFQLEVGVVPIWDLVRKTVSAVGIQARKRNIALNFTIEDFPQANTNTADNNDKDVEKAKVPDLKMLNVIGDDMRLRQVILNLVSNALKFVDENAGVIEVTAAYIPDGLPLDRPLLTCKDGRRQQPEPIPYPRDGAVKIAVRDNGEGLTEEQLQLLFREGVQFDANKLQAGGGSGLGLYITKGLVEQHGGSIRVDSPGRKCGSTFTIYLPLYECPEPLERDRTSNQADTLGSASFGAKSVCTTSTENGTTPLEATPRGLRRRHILVVDDAAMNRKMLMRLLERSGHTCDSAANGQEAVDAVLKNQEVAKGERDKEYDTVLMDFEMPVLNGPDATKVIRSHGCKAFIVGVTGNVLLEDVNYFKSKGADAVLSKPLRIAELNEAWEKFNL